MLASIIKNRDTARIIGAKIYMTIGGNGRGNAYSWRIGKKWSLKALAGSDGKSGKKSELRIAEVLSHLLL